MMTLAVLVGQLGRAAHPGHDRREPRLHATSGSRTRCSTATRSYSETVVLEKRLSESRPGQGVVTLEHTGRNQDGVVVATATRTRSCGAGARPVTELRAGPGAPVLPRGPPRPLREGRRAGRRRDPRPRGRASHPTPRRRPGAPGRERRWTRPATIVRVNPVGTADFAQDLDALRRTPYRHGHARQDVVGRRRPRAGAATTSSRCSRPPPGVRRTPPRSPPQPNVVGLMWGAEDLVASLGGTSSRVPTVATATSPCTRGPPCARRGRVRQGRDRRRAPRHRATSTGWPQRRPTLRPAGSPRPRASTRRRST